MRILIKGGMVTTAADSYRADILVEGEKIKAVGGDIAETGVEQVIEAAGKLVFPGGIDVHTHFDMPFGGTVTADDFKTGTTAAAVGGTTCIIDYAIQPSGGALTQAVETWHRKAAGKCAVDYGFHLAVTDPNPEVLEEIPGLIAAGYPSFKIFMAYKGVFQIDDLSLLKILRLTARYGGMVLAHAENGDIIQGLAEEYLARGQTAPLYHALSRPSLAEEEAVNRFLTLARIADAPAYVVHLSTAGALAEVAKARAEGRPVFAETCPQYLFLSMDRYEEPNFEGAKYVMSPPLRPKGNEKFLWQGLKGGTLQVVASDHCSFNFRGQKELGREDFTRIPNGAPGVETRLKLIYAGGVDRGLISPNRMVELTSTAPAKLFGLFPRKGTIAPGSDADLVIFDPDSPFVITKELQYQNVDYNPFEGFEGRGLPESVFCRGQLIVDQGLYVGPEGHGRFLAREPGFKM